MKIQEFNNLIRRYVVNKKVYSRSYTALGQWADTPNYYKIKNIGHRVINGQKCKISIVADTSGRTFLDIKNYNFAL